MSDKMSIRLRIESRSEGQRSVQTVFADQYQKNGVYYLRYTEPDVEMGRTVTTIRLENNRIRLLRQGDVQSELTFELGCKRFGSYQTAHGSIELETDTTALDIRWDEKGGEASWSYELLAGGDSAGRFTLTLTADEERPGV